MFDIHAHVLPGIDDGPRTMEEAVGTVGALVSEGVTNIVATPHFNDLYAHVSAIEVRERLGVLQHAVYQKGLRVRLWAGHEVHLDADTEEALTSGNAGTINGGPYVLLELSQREFPLYLASIIGRLRMRGFLPVIAHAERYAPVQRDPEVLVPLVEAGALLQITASSLVGSFGRRTQQTAETLLRQNLAHIMASDAHAVSFRPARFAEGLRSAGDIVGGRRVREMVLDVPQAIVMGKPVSVPPIIKASPPNRQRFWFPARER